MAQTEERGRDFDVVGMTCAACARRVEKTLSGHPGVESAGVNFALNRATVHGGDATDEELIAAVDAAGYKLVPRRPQGPADTADAEDDTRDPWRRFLVAAAFTLPALVLGMAGYMHEPWSYVQWALITPVQFWAGRGFLMSAWKQARHRAVNMDTLVAVGTLAAYLYSVYAVFTHGHIYFETAGVIITFLLLGKYFERRSKSRASHAVRSLLELGAKSARVVRGGIEVEVPVDAVAVGDMVRIRPGEKVPTDGLIREGDSSLDESMLTGESVPVDKGPGAEVFGGTLNTSGSLLIEATRVGGDTALANIARLVEQAQTRKAPIEHLADRVASVFVPVVLVIAALTLAGWLATGHSFESSVIAAVAVLIIACPCAMGLATPAAIMVGTGRGAGLGIVIKGGDVLERSGKLDVVALDKTGTLTTGRMSLVRVVPAAALDERELLTLAASAEALSEHPIARAIVDGAAERGIQPVPTLGFTSSAGLGVTAGVHGRKVRVGRRAYAAPEGVPDDLGVTARGAEEEGGTVVWVAGDDKVLGFLEVSDTLKPSARAAVDRLRELGVRSVLITGDNERAAASVASAVGVDDVRAGVLPGGKVDVISGLQAGGARVAMIGDGVNDAPALAQADLGVAIGSGADVAIEAADLTLVGGDPLLAVSAIELSRRTLTTIKQNLFWAFFYNVIAIPAAIAGVLNPMIAAAAMAFSSVSVVLNALRLRRFTPVRP